MLIFLHIPKTGGSTLIPLIDWNYNNQTYSIPVHRKIQTFIDLPNAEKQTIQALQGQLFYGIHQYIPQDSQYITILRHPIKRVVSQYFYENVRKQKLGEPLSDSPIEHFLEREPFQAYTQLNLIAGGDTIEDALKRPLPVDALDRAKTNIESHFPVVGLIDAYDESILLMKRHFGWQRAFYQQKNVNQGRKRFEDFSKATQKIIEQACQPELELYEYAQKRLTSQLEAQDAQFWQDLKTMQQANQRFTALYKLAAPIRHTKLWFAAKRILRTLQGN